MRRTDQLVRLTRSLLPAVLLGGLTAAAAGCLSNEPTNEPTAEDYDDVATSVGALLGAADASSVPAAPATAPPPGAAGEVASLQHALRLALGELPAGFQAQADGTYTGTRGGLTFAYQLSCADGSSVALPQCGPTTDTATLTVDWQGNFNGRRVTAEANRSGTWTLTGVQSDAPKLTGRGEFSASSSFTAIYRPVTRTFNLTYRADYLDVVLSKSTRRPVGGAIHYVVHAERTRDTQQRAVDVEIEVDARVTFSADGTATLVLDGSRTYTVQPATGEVTPAS
jgi:hypothetical protein